MRWLGGLAALPPAVLIAVFAVANRQDMRLELWPLPWAVDLPAYLAVLGSLVVGMALGAAAMWLSGHGVRRRAREQRRRADSLERQLQTARQAAAVDLIEPPRTG